MFFSVEDMPSLDEAVRQANVELQNENKNLHLLVTGLHEKHHQMNLKVCQSISLKYFVYADF